MDPSTFEQPIWYIGHHESKRSAQISEQLLREAQDANYDMLTIPITTPQFHSSVQAILSTYIAEYNHEHEHKQGDLPVPLIPPLKPEDSHLFPIDSISQYIAISSSWIDLASPDPIISNVSRQVLNLELAYAAFCGIQNVIIRAPTMSGSRKMHQIISQFARAVSEALAIGPYLQLHILFPITPDKGKGSEDLSNLSRFSQLNTSETDSNPDQYSEAWEAWEAWDLIRSVCNYNGRISVALELSKHLSLLSIHSRWYSEPVRILMIPESSFIPNRVGQPVLSKGHKAFITKFMRLRLTPWILLSGVGPLPSETEQSTDTSVNGHTPVETQSATDSLPLLPTPAEASQILQRQTKSLRDDPTPHLSYLRYLQRNQPPKSTIERFGVGYQDHLQAPLQPLADDLESITYEVFEKDPVKYEWYERAIMHVLLDWSAQGKSTSSNSGAVVVAVVGAGRGPLVTRALRASKSAQVPIELWAVEKNTNAYVLLQRHNQTHWNGQVTVVRSYMKAWRGPLKADGSHYYVDILVSELLGSFADNELSPECLDGVQHVLNPTHGISIPTSYTAHLTPIATPKIHADLLGKSIVDKDCFEVPYVVMLHQFDYLSNFPESHDESPTEATQTRNNATPLPEPVPNVQECWSFTHPQPSAILAQSTLRRAGGMTGGSGGLSGGDGWNEHNTRFKQLNFPCASRGVCHGLAGYFETTLYSSQTADAPIIELSTNPVTMATKSADMISWFPIFFPLKTPLKFPDESELVVNMWRMTDDRKVWYEWLVETFAVIDSGKGKWRVRLGASELHSSKKNACLM